MCNRFLIFTLLFFINQFNSFSQEERIIDWKVINFDSYEKKVNSNTSQAITLLYHDEQLMFLFLDLENECILLDADVHEIYLDTNTIIDKSHIKIKGSLTLRQNKSTNKGNFYINLSCTGETADIINFNTKDYKSTLKCKSEGDDMKFDLLAIAIIGTKSKYGEIKGEKMIQEIANVLKSN